MTLSELVNFATRSAMPRVADVRRGSVVLVAAVSLASCTTYVHPVNCGNQPNCGELRDVKYCENLVVRLRGSDCAKLGLVVGRPFVLVSAGHCVSSNYSITKRDCSVTGYDPIGEFHDWPPGTVTFEP